MHVEAGSLVRIAAEQFGARTALSAGSRTYTFDSFECAIHQLAPRCAHCDCRVIGHGVEVDGRMFCCAHCARHTGAREVADRA